MLNNSFNIVLTFNIKPESDTFSGYLSPYPKNKPIIKEDTFAEWDTWETIEAVRNALMEKHFVTLVEANLDAFEKIKNLNPDIVFNIAEGFWGLSREAQIPAMLDLLNIPYTGSDPLTLCVTLDKSRTKEILSYYGIPNPKFKVFYNEAIDLGDDFEFPLMVKPVAEGSGKGIFATSVVHNEATLIKEVERVNKEYEQPALVEKFLVGREFTVSILGNGEDTLVLPIIEIDFAPFPKDFVPIYSYEAKWILDGKENQLDIYQCPAKISNDLRERIKEVALRAYRVLRCRDWSRIDIRLDESGVPNIIEVNPLPGILPDPKENSCFPKAARTYGLSYNEMINEVLRAALKRHRMI